MKLAQATPTSNFCGTTNSSTRYSLLESPPAPPIIDCSLAACVWWLWRTVCCHGTRLLLAQETLTAFLVQDGERWGSDPLVRASGAPVLLLELVGPQLAVSGVGGCVLTMSRESRLSMASDHSGCG